VAEVEGIAQIDTDAPRSDDHAAYVAKYGDVYSHRKMDPVTPADEFTVAIRITPTRIRAF